MQKMARGQRQAAGRYYRRHRRMRLVAGSAPDGSTELGEEVSALITRYRYGARRRKPHYVYWWGGTFYRARNCAVELGPDDRPARWEWALEPIAEASAWDAYAAQTEAEGLPRVTLAIRDGRARAMGSEGTPYAGAVLLDGTEGAGYVADLLGLDRPERGPEPERREAYRPRHMRAA